MNLLKSFLCFSLLLLFVASARAQDDRVRLGLGVGFGQGLNINLGEEDLSGVTLPIDFANFTFIINSKMIRFEPNFGFFNYSQTIDVNNPYENYKREQTISNFRIGAVIAYANAVTSVNLYYGLNIGVIISSTSADISGQESNDESKTDFFIGPAIGGEYMFSDNFSLGGEIQVNYISVGQFDQEGVDPDYTVDVSESVVSTRGMIILRWYVN